MIAEIGILTRCAGCNYGSTLQAYAMSHFIKNEGYTNRIIDYDEYAHSIRWRVRPALENVMWQIARKYPTPFRKYFPGKYRYLQIRKQQQKRFRNFEMNFLPLTVKRYKNQRQLKETCNQFQTLVCGSDQIWSPLLFDPAYMFDFVTPQHTVKTVAYAPSLGVTDKSLISEKAISLIKNINHVSCREEQGAKILSELLSTPAEWVLDPTLMVAPEEWEKLCANKVHNEGKPYILCYFLGNRNLPEQYIAQLKKKSGFKVLNIQSYNWMNELSADEQIQDAGPAEFLTLIKNAAWVCTNSFHGMIFSFLFKKPVSIFERFRSSDNDNQNSRIHSLARILKLENHIIDITCTPEIEKVPDYAHSQAELEKWQNKSRQYLRKALSN